MFNIVLFGAPGSGKGTHAVRLQDEYGLVHFSTGEYLRNEINRGSDLGNMAKMYIESGKLVPDDIIIGIIEHEIEKNKSVNGYIFDGFPRTVEQARRLDELLQRENTDIKMVISLHVSEEELLRRLLKRGTESGRGDDNENVIRERFNVYRNQTMPLIDYYKSLNKFYEIHGEGNVEDIYNNIIMCINKVKE